MRNPRPSPEGLTKSGKVLVKLIIVNCLRNYPAGRPFDFSIFPLFLGDLREQSGLGAEHAEALGFEEFT